MKQLFSVLFFFGLIIIQTTFGSLLAIGNAVPNLLLTYTVLYSLSSTPVRSGLMGAVCGLVMDMTGSGLIGFNALLVMYMAVIANHISNKIYCEKLSVSCIMVLVHTFILSIIKISIVSIFNSKIPFWYTVFCFSLPEAIYNMVVTLILYWWIKWISNEYIRGI